MEEYINQLCDILEQETRIYRTILVKSKEKTDIVVAGKVSELDHMVKLEHALVMQMGKLEQQREEVIARLADALNIDKNSFNFNQLIQRVSIQNQKRLRGYQEAITDTMEQLKEVNELNGQLIKHALDYVEFSMNVMTSSTASGNTYERKGSTKDNHGTARSFFDMKL